MSTTCLVSNFNYAPFVVEAIEGALRQTVPFDEIIVVDDGSTDGSIELLKKNYAAVPRVQIVDKGHDGQLSCFNAGAARATGDIVFFLDADDVYEPRYLEEALSVYHRQASCDFLFCGRRLFGLQDDVLLPYPTDRDFGYSVLSTAHRRRWIGAATSCLSMRRTVLNKILPIPFVDDWRVRADDCLVFGASLAPARKRYLAQPLVRYRVHQNNYYHGQPVDQSSTYRRRLAINRLFQYLECKLGYNLERLTEFHHREFCTIESPTLQQLADYLFIGRSARISLSRRMACFGAMVGHYLQAKWRGDLDVIVDEPESSEGPVTLPFMVPDVPPATTATARQRRAA